METKEIIFTKYRSQSADYHYQETNCWNIFRFNLFLYTRYLFVMNEVIKHIASKKEKRHGLRILDIGCGDGVLIYLLQKKLKSQRVKFFGVDLSIEALQVAKRKIPAGEFKRRDAYHTELPNNYFDVIISSDVIEHLRSPHKIFTEIKRIAKNKAAILIATPVRHTEEPEEFHVREFFPNEFKTLVGEYFSRVIVIQTHPLFWFLLYAKIIRIGRFYISFWRYLINLTYLIFRINPFAVTSRKTHEKFSYMLTTAINN